MTAGLTEAVRSVHETRQALATTEATIREQRAAFEAQIAGLLANQKAQRAAVEQAEVALKAMVTLAYAETHEKKPVLGVEVKTFQTIRYDEARALEWGRTAGMCIVPESLDRKAFEKVAKATALPFVEYGEEVRVQIATDLSAAVAPTEVSA